ncbi:acetolactate synthase [Neofusicoccum parvum]|nr:acetolactate synthase [Neofusicoccum parvum]
MPVHTVADLFLESLAEAGVDYLFAVLGSDHPSIIEAYTRRQQEGNVWPKLLIFLHEFVALSAADGFARLTKRPQCVIVHVDVGTAALGQGLHNASSGRAPVLIFAGQAPSTMDGELPGSRTEHVQWYQDIPSQPSLVSPYTRFTAELKHAAHTRALVHRALALTTATSPGPAYLTATREVLASASAAPPLPPQPSTLPTFPSSLGALPPSAATAIAASLAAASRPLVVTGYLGRATPAVHALVALADALPGLRVLDAEAREMSFPATHRANVFRSTGAAARALREADVVLVLDADVPWIPARGGPAAGAVVWHVDADAGKERMVLFGVGARGAWQAECGVAVGQVCEAVKGELGRGGREEFLAGRWEELGREWEAGREVLARKAEARADGRLTVEFLFRALREGVPRDAVWVSDVVTNQVALSEQLALEVPGTNFTKGGSGLGWAGGAAIGIKLATELYDTVKERPCVNRKAEGEGGERFVCSITGDGSFIFGAPSAVYWAQHQHRTPFLTVVVNNGGWKATRSCINDVHPDGLAAKTSDEGLGIDLRGNGPDYLGIAKAAAGGNLVAERVDGVGNLREVIGRLVKAVQERKVGALLEAVVV